MFLYCIENFVTFLRYAMWFRALASMPLTHVMQYRVNNTYNNHNLVVQFISVVLFISWFNYHLSIA